MARIGNRLESHVDRSTMSEWHSYRIDVMRRSP